MPKIAKRIWQLIVFALLIATSYVGENAIVLGGFGFAYKYLISLLIIAIVFIGFLIWPEVEKFQRVFSDAMVLSTALLTSIIYSMLIWILQFAGLRNMTRGLFYPVYIIIGFATAAALLYLYESSAVWIAMTAVTAICMYRIVMGIVTYGFAQWYADWLLLVQTMGIEVGPSMIVYEEYNEPLFGLGVYMLYVVCVFIKQPSKRRKIYLWILAFLALFSYITGFKRIAFVGTVVSIALFLFGDFLSEIGKERLLKFVITAMVVVGIGYIVVVRTGLFTLATYVLNIDTKGRDVLYESVKDWYSISPTFFGNGLGYVSRSLSQISAEVRALMGDFYYSTSEVHNDFLRNYIELGFYLFPVWLYLMTGFRVNYFKRTSGGRAALMAAAGVLYMYVTYLTDNTYYYYQTNMAMALVVMTFAMDEKGPVNLQLRRN